MHTVYDGYNTIRIDYYNEELNKIFKLYKMCDEFNSKVINLKPKYENEIKYSIDIKNSLISSLDNIRKFLDIQKKKIDEKINKNKIPLRDNKIIESFDNDCNDLNRLSKNKHIIVFIIIFVIILYIIY